MKTFLILTTALLATGCTAQPELSSDGSMVREIYGGAPAQCSFLGIIEGAGGTNGSHTENRLGALTDARNKVAARGGNAMYVAAEGATIAHRVQVEAYNCKY